ncbi:dimethylaniline monooxygenase [N-oxide-forming] 2-like [Centruroides vittatus]|uniref:dimethylaniline monooxygenase [N-oxide-forming] 2-like n=1 Tax=Centruroides vittatus TaxID=120091 RepID=UPI0035108E46
MKSVAVIGAGVSGLTSIKSCLEEGLDVTCYEKSENYGGLWRYRDEGVSVAKNTVMNTSKDIGAFSDFPPPKEFPQYMPHQTMIKYLEMYAEKFQLNSKIHHNHEVLEIKKEVDYEETGRWKLRVMNKNTKEIFEKSFDGVMICTGHHDFPHIPPFPGLENFKGHVVHTRNYKSAEGCEDKPVLIIGIGNSGADAAVDMSETAKIVYLSARGCFWVIPRLTKDNKPGDAAYRRRPIFLLQFALPYFLLNFITKYFIIKDIDDITYNKKPDDLVLKYIPVVNDKLTENIRKGNVVLKNKIDHFTSDGVVFEGETNVTKIDLVVLATGYDVKLPMIDSKIISTENETLELYKYIFPPNLPHFTLGLIGFLQPFGAVFPIFELQARWFVMMLMNKVYRPSVEEMIKDIKDRRNLIQYGRWKSIRAEWIHYLDDISASAGVRPDFFKLLFTDPILFWKCYLGPCLPYQFRLKGYHTWKPARSLILNYNDNPTLTTDENSYTKLNIMKILTCFLVMSLFSLLITVIF